MRRKTINHLLATGLFVAGAVFWAVSGWAVYHSRDVLRVALTAAPPIVKTKESCATAADKLGFRVTREQGRVVARFANNDIAALQQGFRRASVLIPMCKGYQLETFCAGNGCGPNYLFLSLVEVKK